MPGNLYKVPPPLSEEPLVSIFIFCLNGARTIRKAIESVLAQSYRNIELVIQDGLSTDGTLEIIRSFNDPRIQLVSEKDANEGDAMFRVLRRCRGELIGSCLSDEELLPHAIADAVAYFRKNPEAGALHRDVYYTDLAGKPDHLDEGTPYSLIDYLAWTTVMHFVSAFFRTAALHDIGLLAHSWAWDCSELEFWTRLGDQYRIDYVPGLNAKYAAGHPDQLSNSMAFRIRMVRSCAQMVRGFYKESRLLQGDEVLRTCIVNSNLKWVADNVRNDPEGPAKLRELGEYCQRELDLLAEVRFTIPLAHKLHRAGKADMAINIAQQVLQLSPSDADACSLLAQLLSERGLADAALPLWESPLLRGNRDEHLRSLETASIAPSQEALHLLRRQKRWASTLQPPTLPSWSASGCRSERLRIGIHAADWESEEAQRQIVPLLRMLDASRFELICYGGPNPSSLPEICGVRSVPTTAFSETEFAEVVRADHLDALVETSGMRPGHRWAALTARCARIQIAYLGGCGTTATANIDYLLADTVSYPEKEKSLATEKIVRLPGALSCFDFEPPQESRSAWVENGCVTFGCLEPASRLNPEVIELWICLLNMMPQTRLLLSNEEVFQVDVHNYLRAQFDKYRVARNRLRFIARQGDRLLPQLHDQIDIALDPFPGNGTIGTAAALARGVPVVTLQGNRFTSRQGASLLMAAGCSEFVADTPRNYIVKATTLARDPVRLQELRQELPNRVRAHGLTDVPRFAKAWGDAIAALVT